MNNLKTAVAIVVTILGLLGAVWAMEEHYVPRDYHLLCINQVQQQMLELQKTNQIQRTQDQAFYWMRIEAQLREELVKNPNDMILQRKLNEVVKQKMNAQQRLDSLQE
jgi:hypothetical protein